jgi:2-C-methyl-D-erythritol 4-phosphate cytidylyltransferase
MKYSHHNLLDKKLFCLIVGSDLASQLINGSSLHQLALGEAFSFCKESGAELIEVKREDLISTLQSKDFDVVIIHDELLPLVSAVQMQRTLNELGQAGAVRPTMAFTETIKSLDAEHRLNQTIDREKVRRISSPEVITHAAIDFAGEISTWSLPLKANTQTLQIESEAQGIRVNSVEEIKILEALLQLADPAQK